MKLQENEGQRKPLCGEFCDFLENRCHQKITQMVQNQLRAILISHRNMTTCSLSLHHKNTIAKISEKSHFSSRYTKGVARGLLECPWAPVLQAFFDEVTKNRWRKCNDVSAWKCPNKGVPSLLTQCEPPFEKSSLGRCIPYPILQKI